MKINLIMNLPASNRVLKDMETLMVFFLEPTFYLLFYKGKFFELQQFELSKITFIIV